MAKNQEVAKRESSALEASPELIAHLQKHAGEGAEALGKDDVRPPRLALAQAMSPQVKRGDAKYIDGLREGNLFNDLTGENYGDGPVEIVVITALGARGMQFASIDDGGGIIDGNVPLSDPRMQFTTDEKGKRVKPIATKFYDYLVFLPQQGELMALSMKGTQIKVGMRLNSLAKYMLKVGDKLILKPPTWARTFNLGTAMEKSDSYSWANFTVAVKGPTPLDICEMCESLKQAYAGKNIIIEREPGSDDIPPEEIN